MRITTGLVVTSLCLMHAWAIAQPLDDRRLSRAQQGPDLKFPEEPKELSVLSPLEMAIYSPSGAGPFPTIVILHTCGGLRPEIHDWTKRALERGYAVFVMDSLGQRGFKNGCNPPNGVLSTRGAKDALQAREHLRKFAFVDQGRVALVGYSWGAMAGLLVSSSGVAGQFSSARYDAVVSFYPECYRQRVDFEWLRGDVDKPLLVLMGEEDNETPPSECIPRLEKLKEGGAPVEWHLYPATTHCWDCSSMHNSSKTDMNGNQVTYRYDEKVTQDSARRMFEFLSKHLKAGK